MSRLGQAALGQTALGQTGGHVWVLNLDAEHELATAGRYTRSRALAALVARQSGRLLGTLVAAGDVVVDGEPSAAELELLRGRPGLAWSPTPTALARLRSAGAEVEAAPPLAVLREVNARPFAAAVREPLRGASFEKHLARDLESALARLALPADRGWLVRRPFGAAGRGRRRLRAGRPEPGDERAWLAASLAIGPLVIEPWVEIVREYTRSGWVTPEGQVLVAPPCFQETTPAGAWTRTEAAQPDDVPRADDEALARALERAGRALSSAGYFGPFGIDAFRHRRPERPSESALNPLSEINARFTMDWTTGMGARTPHRAPAHGGIRSQDQTLRFLGIGTPPDESSQVDESRGGVPIPRNLGRLVLTPYPLLMLARTLEIALTIATGLALALPARSQAYPAYTYEERDGLLSGEVYDIAQESTGRMWFATRAGLVSYDGQAWRLELPPAPGRPLAHLVIDDQDRIWAATHSTEAGLMSRPRAGSWCKIPSPEGESRQILELETAREGDARGVLVVAHDQVLYEYWPGGWRAIELPEQVTTVLDCERRGEHVFLATNSGLWARTAATWRHVDLALPDDFICCLAEVGEREVDPIWLVGRGWLGLLRGEHFSLVLEDHNAFSKVLALNRARAGVFPAVSDGGAGVWFGQHNRLAHFDGSSGELRYQGVLTGLVASGANALFRDLDGNTWIATHRGISRVSSQRFTTYNRSSGFFADEVNSILEHPPGRLIFGHPGGLTFFDLASKTMEIWALPLSPEEAETNPVLDLSIDLEGNLWMAAYLLGVICMSPSGEILPAPELPLGTRAHTVRCHRDGRLWIGTESKLFRWDGRELEQPADAPFRGPVRRIGALDGGKLALATMGFGAWIETDAGWQHLTGRVPGTAQEVYAIYGDRHGRIWVGAGDGLFSDEEGELVRRALGGEPMQEPVYSINQDAEGRFWFGTQHGVVSWDGASAHRYGVHQGLAGLETNRAANLLDSTGSLWFGTVEGVSRYSPNDDRITGRALVVELLGIDAGGRPQALDQPAALQRGTNLDFRFRAISFREEGTVEYRYRLEGFDPDWVRPGGGLGSEFARYTNLPAGTYSFAVQARSPGGSWGAEARSRALRVLQAFWRTGWFIGLSLLAIGGLGFGSWRLWFERRNARELKRQVELRTAELVQAQKLESLGLLAGGVAHDFNNLLTAIMGHSELARDGASGQVGAHLDSIDRASERGAALTKSLLGYARRQESSPRALS